MRRLSPIAVITVAAAAAAVTVVAALQEEKGGRFTVRDAAAAVDPAHPRDLRIYLTLVNDGGEDRIVGLETPLAAEVALVGGETAEPQGELAMPAGSSLTLAPEGPFLLARDVAWDELTEAGFPLVLDFAQADAIYVAVPVGDAATQ